MSQATTKLKWELWEGKCPLYDKCENVTRTYKLLDLEHPADQALQALVEPVESLEPTDHRYGFSA